MREEDIEVPYARESRALTASTGRESFDNLRSPPAQPPTEVLSPRTDEAGDYYDRISFASNLTNKSKAAQGVGEDAREQKLRAEYEFKIAGLERRVAVAEGEREDARRALVGEKEKRQEWEDEVRGLKEVRPISDVC